VFHILRRFQESRAHCGRGGQGDAQGDRDRNAESNSELPEQPSHDAAHQEEWDKTEISERLMDSTVGPIPGTLSAACIGVSPASR